MVGTTAQLVALACHFNGRVRDLSTKTFFPTNSTCKFCEYIHFVRPRRNGLGHVSDWTTVADTPDQWLLQEARVGRTAIITYQSTDNPPLGASDRMTAGVVR